MKKTVRAVAVSALTLAAVGCAPAEDVQRMFVTSCVEDPASLLEGVDWTAARAIDMTVFADSYEPMIVTLAPDTPYVLRVSNQDGRTHHLHSPGFMGSIAVESLAVGEAVFENGCLDLIAVPGHASAELRFVTGATGRYEFSDMPTTLWPVMSSMAGVFYVKE